MMFLHDHALSTKSKVSLTVSVKQQPNSLTRYDSINIAWGNMKQAVYLFNFFKVNFLFSICIHNGKLKE